MNPIVPAPAATIWSLGHSNRALTDFLALIHEFRLEGIADVRRYPRSKRNPHFDSDPLAASLSAAGIGYRHFPELGGHREPSRPDIHPALTEPAFRGYAEQMAVPEYEMALGRLEAWALERRIAVMCAEADPTHCHRYLLSDALVRDGIPVTHVLAPGKTSEHRLSPLARLEGRRLIYDVGVFSF